MRIISWNINGIGKRFDELEELAYRYRPNFICLQKVRCNDGRDDYKIEGYRQLFNLNDYGSWSGVTTYWKIPEDAGRFPGFHSPERINDDFLSKDGHMQVFDCKDFFLVNAYVPFANKTIEGAETYRQRWNAAFQEFIKKLTSEKSVAICGDLNIVHTIKDTCDKRLEQNRPCFNKWERENFNSLLKNCRLIDSFREINQDANIPTFYGNYRSTGLGNRIDYFLISCSLLASVTAADILSDFGTGQSVPIILDFEDDDV